MIYYQLLSDNILYFTMNNLYKKNKHPNNYLYIKK